jgi:hypothetical protein
MAFDVEGALRSGYSLTEVTDYLGQQNKFDVAGARRAGYSDSELVRHLMGASNAPKTGFIANLGAGFESAKGDIGSIGAALGVSGAEEYSRKQQQRANEKATIPEFSDISNVGDAYNYVSGLAGRAVPYMVAPIAAAVSAPAGVAAAAAGTAAGAIQFFGTDLTRQLQEGKTAETLDIASAAAAAPFQAALDTVGFRYIPGLRKIFGQAGVKMSDDALRDVMKTRMTETLAGKVVNYGTKAVQTAGVEGFTEAGQQVLERAQAGLNITNPEARKEYFDSFIGGAILGGTLAVPGTAIERSSQQGQYEQLLRKDVADAANQKAAAANQPTVTETVADSSMGFKPTPTLPNTYAEAVQEVERLKQEPQTEEVKTRIAELEAYKQRLLTEDIEGMRRDPYAEPKSLEDQIKNQTAMQGEFREMADLPTREVTAAEETPVVEKEMPTVLEADTLNATGLSRQSGIYKQLLGKDLTNLEDLDAVMQIVERAKTNNSLTSETKQTLDSIATQAFAIYGQQGEMFGPRGGVLEPIKPEKVTSVQQKIDEITKGKDLTDPAQIEAIQAALTDYANAPNRSAEAITEVSTFLDTLPSSTPEATDVLKPTESIGTTSEPSTTVANKRRKVSSKGITAPDGNGVDDTGAIAGQPDAGEAAQPTALAEAPEVTPEVIPEVTPEGRVSSNEAITTLMANGYKRSEATQHVRSVEENGTVALEDIDSVIGDQPQKQLGTTEPSYTPEEREMAERHASRVGGTIVWQNGDLALIRGYSIGAGTPVYMGAKGDIRATVDIENLTDPFISDADKAILIKEKKNLEDADAKQHATKSFPSFTNEQIITSASTPKGIGGIIKGWSDLLGIKANIYISTVDDVKKDKDKFTGPYRAIGSSALDARNLGEMRRLPNGDYYITFTQTTSQTGMLETLAHELGHVHQKEMYNNASPELKESIKKEHDKWLVARRGETGRQLVDALRAKTTAKRTTVAENKMAADLTSYWRSFDEWYADQVSRWATTNEKPISVVEKFFARLGRAMRAFFTNTLNKRYLPNETFVQYLEKVKEASVRDATLPDTDLQAMKGEATDAFSKWFGNSVVRNENGTPKVMYHGTTADIEAFKLGKEGGALGNGIYLSPNPEFSNEYAKETSGNVMPLYASIKNPLVLDGSISRDPMIEALVKLGVDQTKAEKIVEKAYDEKGYITNEVKSRAIAQGYDGITQFKDGGLTEIVAFNPTQVKSIFNKGTYDPNDGRISYQSRSTEDLTPAGEEAAALNERMKGAGNPKETNPDSTLKKLLGVVQTREGQPSLGTRFRREFVDARATAVEKMEAKFNNTLVDSLGEVRGDLAQIQAQDSGAFAEGTMEHGGIQISKDGLIEIVDRDATMGKVFNIMTKLGDRLGSLKTAMQLGHNAFIAQRAKELNAYNAGIAKDIAAAEAKGNVKAVEKLTDMLIRHYVTDEEIAAADEAMQKFPELKEAFKTFTEYKNNLIDFLVQTGRISKAKATDWKEAAGYVPWTRVEEEVNIFDESPTSFKGGVGNISKLRILDREGSQKEIANVFDNMIGLTSWAVKSGMNAYASRRMVESLPDAFEIKTNDAIAYAQKFNKDRLVFTYKDGERTAYMLGSALDRSAFASNIVTLNPILKAFSFAQSTLRSFVTHMPAFAVSQLIQDGTYRAMLLSGVKQPFSLPAKVAKNFIHAMAGEGIPAELARIGVSGVYDGMPQQAVERARVKYGLEERKGFKKAWDKLEKFSLAADLAVRAAIYEQTINETKSAEMPEGDRRLALYRAKEYINFKHAGDSTVIGTLRHMVPFLNAYIQGMDILVRTMRGKGISMEEKRAAQKLFLATGLKIAAMSTLYAMLVGDDEDYKGMEGYERDKNYIIPGTGLKIPVAPEVGFMFKVIPERIVQYVISQGTERPQDATAFYKGFKDAFINAYGGTNLTPQLIKPSLEVLTNYSFFTGNPIVGAGMKNLDPSMQFTEGTSELAKLFGMAGVSPMKADYLIRGYTGMLGAFVLDATDAVANPDRMGKPVSKLPQLSTFMYDTAGRGYKSEFYGFRESVDQVVDTVNMFKREGRMEELKDYLTEDKMKLYAMKGIVHKAETQLANLRKFKSIIANDPQMPPDLKREKTDEILKQEKELLLAYNLPRLRGMAGM